mmetsp:Transcript_5674/g.17398  ORF Transcript_5674/g.17398 Transcript_5674/m.17398 type:complete len:263 (+) Transcript_5674:629-1417(+)
MKCILVQLLCVLFLRLSLLLVGCRSGGVFHFHGDSYLFGVRHRSHRGRRRRRRRGRRRGQGERTKKKLLFVCCGRFTSGRDVEFCFGLLSLLLSLSGAHLTVVSFVLGGVAVRRRRTTIVATIVVVVVSIDVLLLLFDDVQELMSPILADSIVHHVSVHSHHLKDFGHKHKVHDDVGDKEVTERSRDERDHNEERELEHHIGRSSSGDLVATGQEIDEEKHHTLRHQSCHTDAIVEALFPLTTLLVTIPEKKTQCNNGKLYT